MTVMSTATPAVHRTRSHHLAPHRTGVATYRRRRAAAAGLVALAAGTLGVGVLGVLTGPGDVPASAAGAGTAPPVRTVRVEPGDTLWGLAEAHRGDVSRRRYLDALIAENGGTTAIEAGELVRLP